jgi:alpha-L-fucosidase
MKISRRKALALLSGAPAILLHRESLAQGSAFGRLPNRASAEAASPEPEITPGPFEGTRESLREWQVPDWYRDAKFGVWAHWGPQSAIEYGDWYARNMYLQGHKQYEYHVKVYGHPTKVGYKDVIPTWKAEKFDPDHLLELYKKAGAKYFCSMAVHHDGFDLWNSKYQPRWNSIAVGPKRDIVGAFKKAAVKQGLRFAVSEHLV